MAFAFAAQQSEKENVEQPQAKAGSNRLWLAKGTLKP